MSVFSPVSTMIAHIVPEFVHDPGSSFDAEARHLGHAINDLSAGGFKRFTVLQTFNGRCRKSCLALI